MGVLQESEATVHTELGKLDRATALRRLLRLHILIALLHLQRQLLLLVFFLGGFSNRLLAEFVGEASRDKSLGVALSYLSLAIGARILLLTRLVLYSRRS